MHVRTCELVQQGMQYHSEFEMQSILSNIARYKSAYVHVQLEFIQVHFNFHHKIEIRYMWT